MLSDIEFQEIDSLKSINDVLLPEETEEADRDDTPVEEIKASLRRSSK